MLAVVDTGPLYAAADETDANHEASLDTLERGDLELVIPSLVVAEATYLIGSRLGATAESRFLRALADHDVEGPDAADWPRIAELVERYADFPLGGTDASVVALAERLDTDAVVTFDHRHFAAIQPLHRPSLTLLPA